EAEPIALAHSCRALRPRGRRAHRRTYRETGPTTRPSPTLLGLAGAVVGWLVFADVLGIGDTDS
ncbi:MAG TPA: hypothetical protein VK631_18225, partial [Solirubrobacteraceae bacterium]|nr:hypothetical protein [Solirubrobacteraceae bacterium]